MKKDLVRNLSLFFVSVVFSVALMFAFIELPRLLDSLPWLLMTKVIIGIWMLEEIKMKEHYGESYEEYRSGMPFMFPLPGWLVWILKVPLRMMIQTSEYETRPRGLWGI